MSGSQLPVKNTGSMAGRVSEWVHDKKVTTGSCRGSMIGPPAPSEEHWVDGGKSLRVCPLTYMPPQPILPSGSISALIVLTGTKRQMSSAQLMKSLLWRGNDQQSVQGTPLRRLRCCGACPKRRRWAPTRKAGDRYPRPVRIRGRPWSSRFSALPCFGSGPNHRVVCPLALVARALAWARPCRLLPDRAWGAGATTTRAPGSGAHSERLLLPGTPRTVPLVWLTSTPANSSSS